MSCATRTVHSFPTRRSSDLEEKLAVQASLDELVASYAGEERGVEIRAVAGGYKVYSKPQQHDVVRRNKLCTRPPPRSEEHTSELQSHHDLVCRLLLEKKNKH